MALIRDVDMLDLKLGAAAKAAEKPTIKTCTMPHHRFLQNFLALHRTAMHCTSIDLTRCEGRIWLNRYAH